MADLLPSWRAGPAREAILAFLNSAEHLPALRRVAVLDQDGTLFCERPVSLQLAFFLHEMRTRVAADRQLADRVGHRMLLAADPSTLSDFGLRRLVRMMAEFVAEITPEEFAERVRAFMSTARHPTRGVPYPELVYQPMRELIDALRAHQFAVFLSTVAGIEFLRVISPDLYGVPPEAVVGTPVAYRYDDHDGHPTPIRTSEISAELNEGPAQVLNLQGQLGRRPIFVAANSPGDRAMIDYTLAGDGPSMAVLIDHDDEQREYAYQPQAYTFTEDEPIAQTGRRLGWTVVSMREDWTCVFAGDGG